MLPNWAPLAVAERFKVLEALYPGRIDLGLGRAPGTDPATSYMLRRRQGVSEQDDFLERFQELMLLETRGFPGRPSVPQGARHAGGSAAAADLPARLIRLFGAACRPDRRGVFVRAPFRHLRRGRGDAALPRQFPSSAAHDKPYAILATHVVCADTDEEAERLAGTVESISYAVRRASICRSPRPKKRWPTTTRDRQGAHRAEPLAHVGGFARDGQGQARAPDRRNTRR